MSNTKNKNETFTYAKTLSSLFCSMSIILLSILCLLNSLSIDMYSALVLLKVVLPACFCFWFLGFSIGKILDSYEKNIEKKEFGADDKAYEIPSMFNVEDGLSENNDLGAV